MAAFLSWRNIVRVNHSRSGPAPAAVLSRKVAIIDDGFIFVRLEDYEDGVQTAVAAVIASAAVAEDLADLGLTAATPPNEILEALTAPPAGPSGLRAEIAAVSPELAERLEDRELIRQLSTLIQAHTGEPPLECRPDEPLPDLRAHDLVLVDYYMQGREAGGDLAQTLAKAVRDQHGGAADQQIVLMSSLEQVRDHRVEFRKEAMLTGASFAFVAKPDMNKPWKVKANFGMLDRARPHAPVLGRYNAQLKTSLEAATAGLIRIANDLDIGDYAFLQSQALMNDGHPLGDYVSWLLSSQLTTLAFENTEIRKEQWAMDRLQFREKEAFAATEPSIAVADLFHNALLSRNMGPLGPHPRADPEGPFAAFPLVQLGDLFLDKAGGKAAVILSADCDLAFAPVDARPPVQDTPVIIVQGVPRSVESNNADDVPATEGVIHGGQVYRIDWKFAEYRSKELGDLEAWLAGQGYETENRSRLRPLYALKLQQEFGAHLFRVGPPIMPPLTFAAEGRIFTFVDGAREEVEAFLDGEVMLSYFKETARLRLTPKLVDALERAALSVLEAADAKVDAANSDKDKKNAALKAKAVRDRVEDDDFWIDLVNGVTLNAVGSSVDVGNLCRFVRGADWEDPNGARVVMQITERAAAVVTEAA